MNLKEAFRFQNKLQSLMDEATSFLGFDSNLTKVSKTYLRHKVMEEAQDETVVEISESDYAEKVTEVVDFVMYLLDIREKLSAAIRQAKSNLTVDIDSETGLNGKRQEVSRVLQRMANMRSSELLIPNGGNGYRFNNDGVQVAYKCDMKRVTTINFDRNVVRKHLADLTKRADEVSAEIDRCVINAEVDFEPPFNVNDSFADVFEAFAGEISA